VQCDWCTQPLSAGGRQRVTCVHGEMKGTARSTHAAARREAVNSENSQEYCYVITSDYWEVQMTIAACGHQH